MPFPRGQRTTHSKLLLLSARQRAGALWRCDLLGGGLVLKVLPLVRDHPQANEAGYRQSTVDWRRGHPSANTDS